MNNDATKKIFNEDFKCVWLPCEAEAFGKRRLTLIKMDEAVKKKIDSFVDKNHHSFGGSK